MSEQAQIGADGLVQVEYHTGIVVLRMNEPPANALSARLRAALQVTLARIAGDAAVGAVVMIGRSDAFLRGLDFAELGQPQVAPSLNALCLQIEGMPVPVLCALSGVVQGAGLELALAAHHRIALSGAMLSFPDCRLGLGPTGGASQRLPRLVGAALAIDILCDGKAISAEDALASGLVGEVVTRGLEQRALSLAHDLRQAHPRHSGHPAMGMTKARDRSEGLRDPSGFLRAVDAARARFTDPRLGHSAVILEAIEAAALLNFDQGLGFETIRSQALAGAAPTLARLHGFACERSVLVPPRLLSGQRMGRITDLQIVGSHPALAGPIRLALSAGIRVYLDSGSSVKAEGLRQAVNEMIQHEISQSGLAPATGQADVARLQSVASPAKVRPQVVLSDGSIGGEPEQTAVVLLGGTRPGLADEVTLWPGTRPGQVVEICAGAAASLPAQAAAYSLARTMGFQVHLQGPGLPLSQRLRRCLSAVFDHLQTQGHLPQTVAQSLGAMGIGIGPDMALPSLPPGGAAIQAIAVAALANEGARCLQDGAARLPRDVDAAALFHGILPAWRGGPMYQADLVGAMAMRLKLRDLASTAPSLFAPVPLWDALLAQSRSFADLNRDGLSRAPTP